MQARLGGSLRVQAQLLPAALCSAAQLLSAAQQGLCRVPALSAAARSHGLHGRALLGGIALIVRRGLLVVAALVRGPLGLGPLAAAVAVCMGSSRIWMDCSAACPPPLSCTQGMQGRCCCSLTRIRALARLGKQLLHQQGGVVVASLGDEHLQGGRRTRLVSQGWHCPVVQACPQGRQSRHGPGAAAGAPRSSGRWPCWGGRTQTPCQWPCREQAGMVAR